MARRRRRPRGWRSSAASTTTSPSRSTCSRSGSGPAGWPPTTPPLRSSCCAARSRTPQVVGDLAALQKRLDDLDELIAQQREKRKAERAKRLAKAAERKEGIATEAEKLATGNDWRAGADRLRALLEEWKELPRLDKSADDVLWRRFSSARTTYTRRRKAHFAELNEKREGAREIKERLVKEADALADSTDWGPTTTAYRELMRRWKEAGPAPKGIDDKLWKRFRGAQDKFFGARDAANAAMDAEFAENATKKEALLVEAEALLPVKDVQAAKTAFRGIAERWDAAGKVPRDRIKELEGRMRKVEQAIREVEDDAWKRSNPEAHARAADTVAQLESSIADLEAKRDKAEAAAGNDEGAREHAAASRPVQALARPRPARPSTRVLPLPLTRERARARRCASSVLADQRRSRAQAAHAARSLTRRPGVRR